MKIRKKNINFRFKKSKLKSKNEKSIMQRSYLVRKQHLISNVICFPLPNVNEYDPGGLPLYHVN